MDYRLLATVSRSFYLSMRILPCEMRNAVAVAYLLARTTDTVADTAPRGVVERLAVLREMNHAVQGMISAQPLRREFKRDWAPVQGDSAEGELLERFGESLDAYLELPDAQRELVREVMAHIVAGQIGDLQIFGATQGEGRGAGDWATCMPDVAALDTYTWQVAGCVGAFWTDLGFLVYGERFYGGDLAVLREIGVNFGKGLQLVNILRDVHEDLAEGRCYLPCGQKTIERAGAAERLQPFARHWMGQARAGMLDGIAYAGMLGMKRLRLATMLPARIGLETLTAMENANWMMQADRKVKISRRDVYGQLIKSLLMSMGWMRTDLPALSAKLTETGRQRQ